MLGPVAEPGKLWERTGSVCTVTESEGQQLGSGPVTLSTAEIRTAHFPGCPTVRKRGWQRKHIVQSAFGRVKCVRSECEAQGLAHGEHLVYMSFYYSVLVTRLSFHPLPRLCLWLIHTHTSMKYTMDFIAQRKSSKDNQYGSQGKLLFYKSDKGLTFPDLKLVTIL